MKLEKLLLTLFLTLILTACSGRFIDPELANQPTAERAIVTIGPDFTLNNIDRLREDSDEFDIPMGGDALLTNQTPRTAELKPGNYQFRLSYMNYSGLTGVIIHAPTGISLQANLKAGHQYVIQSKLIDKATKINYWMLDQTTGQVVSGKRE